MITEKASLRNGACLVAAAAVLLVLVVPVAAQARRPRPPVVMVIFDELPVTSLLDRNGRIDRIRYPNFAALARGATWFQNATTVSDATKYAIPAMLDGRPLRRGSEPTAAAHPRNLFVLLRRKGYRLQVQEEATDLCPYEACRRRFGARYLLSRDRIERFRGWVQSIEPSRQPTLFYKHTLLPHGPWIFLPSGQRFDRTVLGPIPGLTSSELSVFDPTLVRQAWQRHLIQAGTVDTLLGELLARLEETRLYDRAMLVVTADHGISFRLGATDRRTIVPTNARDIAPIPLFVKYPNQRRGRRDRRLASGYDVFPTIAASTGLALPRGLAGRPLHSKAITRRRRVSVLSRSRVGRVTLSRRELLELKEQALARKLALFGAGRRTLFDFGPNRGLRGRPVKRFRVVEGGGLSASLNEAVEYERINRDAIFLPVHLSGEIAGGAARSRRDIAVAINGVIAGVTRSARLRRRRAEYFSVLVDPRSLREGRNEIEVLAVSRTRKGFGLRRIYRTPPVRPPPSPPAYPLP